MTYYKVTTNQSEQYLDEEAFQKFLSNLDIGENIHIEKIIIRENDSLCKELNIND